MAISWRKKACRYFTRTFWRVHLKPGEKGLGDETIISCASCSPKFILLAESSCKFGVTYWLAKPTILDRILLVWVLIHYRRSCERLGTNKCCAKRKVWPRETSVLDGARGQQQNQNGVQDFKISRFHWDLRISQDFKISQRSQDLAEIS